MGDIDQRNHPVFKMFGRPVAFHRAFVDITGSVTAALMLSQAFYWMPRTKNPDGWFYKSADEWQEETGLTRREQETARKKLRKFDWWQEELRKANGVPTMHYRIDPDGFYQIVQSGLAHLSKPDMAESAKPTSTNPPYPITETTTKITSETTTTDANASAQHEVAPPLSAAQVFRNFHDELQNPKANRAAILHRAYAYCYGEENVPDFGRIGTFAKRVGGAGMALTLMWEFLSRPPNGNVLDYLETTFKGRQADRRRPYSRKAKAQAHDSGRKYSDYGADGEPKRSYSVPADYAYAVAGQRGDG